MERNLMSRRVPNGEREEFCRVTIKLLVKKLTPEDLRRLYLTIRTSGSQPSRCFWVSLRCQDAVDKNLQLGCARVFRWPGLKRWQFRACDKQVPGPMSDSLEADTVRVCVNPYHCQKVTSPVIEEWRELDRMETEQEVQLLTPAFSSPTPSTSTKGSQGCSVQQRQKSPEVSNKVNQELSSKKLQASSAQKSKGSSVTSQEQTVQGAANLEDESGPDSESVVFQAEKRGMLDLSAQYDLVYSVKAKQTSKHSAVRFYRILTATTATILSSNPGVKRKSEYKFFLPLESVNNLQLKKCLLYNPHFDIRKSEDLIELELRAEKKSKKQGKEQKESRVLIQDSRRSFQNATELKDFLSFVEEKKQFVILKQTLMRLETEYESFHPGKKLIPHVQKSDTTLTFDVDLNKIGQENFPKIVEISGADPSNLSEEKKATETQLIQIDNNEPSKLLKEIASSSVRKGKMRQMCQEAKVSVISIDNEEPYKQHPSVIAVKDCNPDPKVPVKSLDKKEQYKQQSTIRAVSHSNSDSYQEIPVILIDDEDQLKENPSIIALEDSDPDDPGEPENPNEDDGHDKPDVLQSSTSARLQLTKSIPDPDPEVPEISLYNEDEHKQHPSTIAIEDSDPECPDDPDGQDKPCAAQPSTYVRSPLAKRNAHQCASVPESSTVEETMKEQKACGSTESSGIQCFVGSCKKKFHTASTTKAAEFVPFQKHLAENHFALEVNFSPEQNTLRKYFKTECRELQCGFVGHSEDSLSQHYFRAHKYVNKALEGYAIKNNLQSTKQFKVLHSIGFFNYTKEIKLSTCNQCNQTFRKAHLLVHMVFHHFKDRYEKEIRENQLKSNREKGSCPKCNSKFGIFQDSSTVVDFSLLIHYTKKHTNHFSLVGPGEEAAEITNYPSPAPRLVTNQETVSVTSIQPTMSSPSTSEPAITNTHSNCSTSNIQTEPDNLTEREDSDGYAWQCFVGLCREKFTKTNARQKFQRHLLQKHFRNEVRSKLLSLSSSSLFPSECPVCGYIGSHETNLIQHFSDTHKVVNKALEQYSNKYNKKSSKTFKKLKDTRYFDYTDSAYLATCTHCQRRCYKAHINIHMVFYHFKEAYLEHIQQKQNEQGCHKNQCPITDCNMNFVNRIEIQLLIHFSKKHPIFNLVNYLETQATQIDTEHIQGGTNDKRVLMSNEKVLLTNMFMVPGAEKELNSQVKEEDLVCETQDHSDPTALDAENCCKKRSLKGSSSDISMKDSNTEAKDGVSMEFCDSFNISSTDEDIDIKEFNITSIEDQNQESFETWHHSEADEMDSASCEKQKEAEEDLVSETQTHHNESSAFTKERKVSFEGSRNDISMNHSNIGEKDGTAMNSCDAFNTSSTVEEIDIKEFNIIEEEREQSPAGCHQNDDDQMDSSTCKKQEKLACDSDSESIICERSSINIIMKNSNIEAKDETGMNSWDPFNTSSIVEDIDIKEFNVTSMEDQKEESRTGCHQNDEDKMETSTYKKQEQLAFDSDSGSIIFVPTRSSSKQAGEPMDIRSKEEELTLEVKIQEEQVGVMLECCNCGKLLTSLEDMENHKGTCATQKISVISIDDSQTETTAKEKAPKQSTLNKALALTKTFQPEIIKVKEESKKRKLDTVNELPRKRYYYFCLDCEAERPGSRFPLTLDLASHIIQRNHTNFRPITDFFQNSFLSLDNITYSTAWNKKVRIVVAILKYISC